MYQPRQLVLRERDIHLVRSWRERLQMAKNPATPPDVLEDLIEGPPWVRLAVAGNPATTAELLARLSSDASAAVRRRVAKHQSLPPHLLETLRKDPEELVREAAARQE